MVRGGQSEALGQLLEVATTLPAHTSLQEACERLVDVLIRGDIRAAGLTFRPPVDLADVVIARRGELLVDPAPVEPSSERLFPESEDEIVEPLTGDLEGDLHLVAPSLASGGVGHHSPSWIPQAAAVISLTLGRLVAEQQREDQQARLAQIHKLASMGQVTAGIVHELNNPLSAILSYSDYLKKKLADRQDAAGDVIRLTRISEAAERIQRFTRSIIDYSRPASGVGRPVQLHRCIDRAIDFCAHLTPSSAVVIQRRFGADIPPIQDGLEDPLTQVFVNLITNALASLAVSGGKLCIEIRHEGGTVVVSVADDGHGIDEAALPHLFNSYFTTRSNRGGFGLGLSIVRRIVEDHGGTISAHNRKPRGAVFVIRLPVEP